MVIANCYFGIDFCFVSSGLKDVVTLNLFQGLIKSFNTLRDSEINLE